MIYEEKKKRLAFFKLKNSPSPEGKVIPHKFLPIAIFYFRPLQPLSLKHRGCPLRQGLRPLGGTLELRRTLLMIFLPDTYECELVVNLHEVLNLVLL